MTQIKILNNTGDTVNLEINGNEQQLSDEESIVTYLPDYESSILHIHRTRVLIDSTDRGGKFNFGEEGQRTVVQLDSAFEIKPTDASCKIDIFQDITCDKEVIFSGFRVEAKGAEIADEIRSFSSKAERKQFITQRIGESVVFDILSAILCIVGILALMKNINGTTANIGGIDFTYPWSIGLTAAGAILFGYSMYFTVKTICQIRKYS